MARVVPHQARRQRSPARLGLALAVLMLAAGSAGPSTAGAASGSRHGPPVVVDAEGLEVGELLAARFSQRMGQAAIRVGDVVVAVDVWAHRITFGTATVAFEATDCTGPPLLIVLAPDPFDPLLGQASGVGPGNVLFLGHGPVATVALGSIYRSSQAVPACGAPFFPVEDVVAAVPLLDLSIFTPPFAVR